MATTPRKVGRTMDIQELKDRIEAGKRRTEERRQRYADMIKAARPDLEVDPAKIDTDILNGRYQISNLEYLSIDCVYGVSERKTDLAHSIEFANKHEGGQYKLIEIGYRVILVSGWTSCIGARVAEYWKDSGRQIKGKRQYRTVYESSKGVYIELNKKRYYL